MNITKLLTPAILLLLFLGTTQLNAQRTLPDVNINTLGGEKVLASDLGKNGKITVVSFWATWCSPCKKELDAINEVYADWVEDYDIELVAITIDTRRALAKVAPMVETKGWEFKVYSDVNSELKTAMNVQSIPHTFLLDQQGNIVYEHSGYLPGDEYDLEDEIGKLSGGE